MPVSGASADEVRVLALPARSHVVQDQRGGERWMRVTWHDEAGAAVLSVWRDGICVATVRVDRADVPGLVAALTAGLAD